MYTAAMKAMHRRDFLRRTAMGSSALALAPSVFGQTAKGSAVSLLIDPTDPVASTAPARWAAGELEQALTDAGFSVRLRENVKEMPAGDLWIISTGRSVEEIVAPRARESLVIGSGRMNGHPVLVACGADTRGLVYALLELTDRVRSSAKLTFPRIDKPIAESPTNPVRSVMRQFTSETLDKPWFYDREMWPRYLTMLAAQRFNRLHLGFGLGYDTLSQVADSYMLFLYPFLLAVPSYNVRVTNLSDAERDKNLDTLRFISEQAVARGLEFQLGVWMHGYQLTNSPRAQNIVSGLNADNHANYCRDALTALLKACPAISAVALRIHGESGVAEGSYDFWKTIFDGVKRSERKVEIDLHAKGIDATMIDGALATGMPVNLSPKYWAEHLGMPYHQAAIRDLEVPVEGKTGAGLMTLSEGSRVFTHYGYADLMSNDRRYTVRHRVFAGTQKILMWGDPASTAAYSRMFQFCGSSGADLMEPLTCRGRRGTGVPGSRAGYADMHLEPKWDFEKYAYWYRTWGRALYNANTSAEVWHRHFGAKSPLESALARVSRILPIVTTAHLPSAACDAYWPEVYWNHPMVGEARGNPYGDTPAPKTFQNVSPLDPQLFSRMSDFAEELLRGDRSGKYSPIEVAQWIEDLAAGAETDLLQAGNYGSLDLARIAIDVAIQIGLGRFFASKFRSGVLYSIFEKTSDRRALDEAVKYYRAARDSWARLSERAKSVYAADLSASDKVSERGQWSDRLPAIDQDLARMEQQLLSAKTSSDPRVVSAILEASGRPSRVLLPITHKPRGGYVAGADVTLEFSVGNGHRLASATLYYRHVNQAERWVSVRMTAQGNVYRGRVPASYAAAPFPLQYYFELREGPERVSLYPGFAADLANQPYFLTGSFRA